MIRDEAVHAGKGQLISVADVTSDRSISRLEAIRGVIPHRPVTLSRAILDDKPLLGHVMGRDRLPQHHYRLLHLLHGYSRRTDLIGCFHGDTGKDGCSIFVSYWVMRSRFNNKRILVVVSTTPRQTIKSFCETCP